MSQHEAQQYADLIVEKLVEWGVISSTAYGKMTESQREELAEAMREKSEE